MHSRTLVLKKETLVELTPSELGSVVGGFGPTQATCDTNCGTVESIVGTCIVSHLVCG